MSCSLTQRSTAMDSILIGLSRQPILVGKLNPLRRGTKPAPRLPELHYVLVAQLSELEFRKRMTGDSSILKNLRMRTYISVAELLQILGSMPPLTLLQICSQDLDAYVASHLLQHAKDSDFTQNVLSATGRNPELYRVLTRVLSALTR